MFKNYLITTFRNLARHKTLAFIYFACLSVSIAACTLILSWVSFQFSFDKGFANAQDIYRIYPHIMMGGNNFTSSMAPPPLGPLLKREFPEVITSTRVWKYTSGLGVLEKDGKTTKSFNEEVYQADSTFFQVFGIKALAGDIDKALSKPSTVVLSKSTAVKYFGAAAFDSNAIVGKNFQLNIGQWKLNCKVTAITDDIPANAHFHYSIILSNITDQWCNSSVWVDNTYYTYVLLKKGTDPNLFETKIAAAVKPQVEPQLQTNFGTSYAEMKTKGNYWEYKLQPVTAIHLHSDFERELEPGENVSNVYILCIAVIFLLIMACINYANLSTANAIQRAKEIGVRKTLGSSKSRLVALVFTESGIISLIAWLIALMLIITLLRPFEQLMLTTIPADVFTSPSNWLIFISLFFVISFLGGAYPAFYLSSFNVVKAIKGTITPGAGFINFKNVLVIIQFFMFIGLIACALLVKKQLFFLLGKSPGFDKENVVLLSDPGAKLNGKYDAFITELKKDPAVLSANVCADYPGSGNDNFPISANYKVGAPDRLIANCSAGYDFLKTFGIKLLQGRDFNRQMDNDTLKRIILNEAAVKQLGMENPVNSFINTRYLNALDIKNERYQVIGVAADFNFKSLHKSIQPLAIFLRSHGQFMAVRIAGGHTAQTIDGIKKAWQSFVPENPFEYHFMDERIDHLYKTEAVLSHVLNILTVLIILVAVMGITGLTLLTIQQKTKEIGIRKVIGASVRDIVFLFSKAYIKWVCISFLFAVPVAWSLMRSWLQGFAYHVDIKWLLFIFSGLIALVIALITVSLQVVKAAAAKPVKSLRSE